MDTFYRDIKILNLYYENASNEAVATFFMEAADDSDSDNQSRAKRLKEKIKHLIDSIIEKLQDFYSAVKTKCASIKFNALYYKEILKSSVKIHADINDKQLRKTAYKLYMESGKVLAEMRKQYDLFMTHKIDYETLSSRSEEIATRYIKQCERISEKYSGVHLINVNTPKGFYMMSQMAKITNDLLDYQDELIRKMNQDVLKEEQKIKVSGEHAAESAAAIENGDTEKISASTSKLASLTSKVNRKTVTTIISILGVATAVGTVTALHKKHSGGSMTESAEDDVYSEDDLDDYMENAFHDLGYRSCSDSLFSDYYESIDISGDGSDDFEESGDVDSEDDDLLDDYLI